MEEVQRVNNFVVCLTPLAKIFQPQYHKELMENPETLWTEPKPFSVVANKASGAIHLTYKKPKLINDPNVLMWLTGGPEADRCRETDYTGIVYAPVQDDAMEALTTVMAAMAEDPEKGKKVQDEVGREITKKYGSQLKIAAELSKDRVMRTIKFVYNNLQKQYQINKENNLGLYQPSETEILCTFALQRAIADTEAKRRAVTSKFEEVMKEIRVM